jgi:2-methylisocitrate lyase-like PEP mutase family enzyme
VAPSAGSRVRALLEAPGVLLLPGVHDALSAKLAERAGHRAAYVSGSAVAMALLGLPDIGLLSGSEMIDQARRITAAVDIPLIADADTGYGNALNVRRTIGLLEDAGLAGAQLEDQSFPKRCGHFDGKSLISQEEMAGKVRAAVAARRDPDFIIVARTDALAVLGLDEAVARARAFAAAGADVLFVEAPRTIDEMQAIATASPLPMLVNVVEGGRTPQLAPEEYAALGFRIVLYPTVGVRVAAAALDGLYRHLAGAGSSAGYPGAITGFDERNEINGLGSWLEWERSFVPPADEDAG